VLLKRLAGALFVVIKEVILLPGSAVLFLGNEKNIGNRG
jgi:hypothetical protein